MNKSNRSQTSIFSPALIKNWEYDYCVNFAIGLARITGWILHVDYWVNNPNPPDEIPQNELFPLRVYVGDDMDNIFDVRGVHNLNDFCGIITGLAAKQALKCGNPSGSVLTRMYSETELSELPLKVKPKESKIIAAMEAIQSNKIFLDKIRMRDKTTIPAYIAAKFTFGWCAPFAEALRDFRKLPATALIATKYSPQFEISRLGYIHSFVLHPDGEGEDVWGKQTIARIAERFGAIEYELSDIEHNQIVDSQKAKSGDIFAKAYSEAGEVIKKYL